MPADRGGVRGFLERFDGQELEVALEATTGWRFVVEEVNAIGAVSRLERHQFEGSSGRQTAPRR
jgi:hypothetical protein